MSVFYVISKSLLVFVLQAKLEGSGELILIPIYVVCFYFCNKKEEKRIKKKERKKLGEGKNMEFIFLQHGIRHGL